LACQIALVPLGAVILTLLYGDARAERAALPLSREQPAPATT